MRYLVGLASAAAAALALAQPGPPASGEVRKIDKAAHRITLRHDGVRSLDMPAMTMVFQVRDAALLDKVQPGDRVTFSAEKSGGAIVVTSIELAR